MRSGGGLSSRYTRDALPVGLALSSFPRSVDLAGEALPAREAARAGVASKLEKRSSRRLLTLLTGLEDFWLNTDEGRGGSMLDGIVVKFCA